MQFSRVRDQLHNIYSILKILSQGSKVITTHKIIEINGTLRVQMAMAVRCLAPAQNQPTPAGALQVLTRCSPGEWLATIEKTTLKNNSLEIRQNTDFFIG